jgi:hypothetical protein
MKGFALLALALALQSAFFFSVMMTPTASEAAAHLAPVDEEPQLVHQLEPIVVVAPSDRALFPGRTRNSSSAAQIFSSNSAARRAEPHRAAGAR